jgi:preprotein translocase subunit SecA
MTGTALTEATEFAEIYKLEVVEIPTNVPVARKDADDGSTGPPTKFKAIFNLIEKPEARPAGSGRDLDRQVEARRADAQQG